MDSDAIMTEFGEIRPNGKNPREITPEALDRLCESIRRDPAFMALRPIIVGADNVIIGGNQRFKACARLGLRELPRGWVAKAADLTPEQIARFILVDNAPEGMSGEWDFGALARDWGRSDLAELGFNLDDVGRFDIPEANAPIDEEAMKETDHECPKCGFKW
jgi:ParB-like chromosome segregation protein Spo0J